MVRCGACGKRDRSTTHYCPDCTRWHGRECCASARFNDALAWCWCGGGIGRERTTAPINPWAPAGQAGAQSVTVT